MSADVWLSLPPNVPINTVARVLGILLGMRKEQRLLEPESDRETWYCEVGGVEVHGIEQMPQCANIIIGSLHVARNQTLLDALPMPLVERFCSAKLGSRERTDTLAVLRDWALERGVIDAWIEQLAHADHIGRKREAWRVMSPVIDLHGEPVADTFLFHFEGTGGRRLLSRRSCADNIALLSRVARFFGGNLANDYDDRTIFIEPDKDEETNNPQDGEPWQNLHERLFALDPLTPAEIAACHGLGAYDDDETSLTKFGETIAQRLERWRAAGYLIAGDVPRSHMRVEITPPYRRGEA